MNILLNINARRNLILANDSFASTEVTKSLNISDTVKDLYTMKIYCKLSKKWCLRKNASQYSGKYVRLAEDSAGSEYYECCFSGKSRIVDTALRKRKRSVYRKTRCQARSKIKFPAGYYHNPDKSINVEQFGDCFAEVSWVWMHNHTIDTDDHFRNRGITKRMRNLLKVPVIKNRVSWPEILEQKKKRQILWAVIILPRTWNLDNDLASDPQNGWTTDSLDRAYCVQQLNPMEECDLDFDFETTQNSEVSITPQIADLDLSRRQEARAQNEDSIRNDKASFQILNSGLQEVRGVIGAASVEKRIN